MNQFVTRIQGLEFAWYSKCGGENAGLDVTISLKNEKGQIVKSSDLQNIINLQMSWYLSCMGLTTSAINQEAKVPDLVDILKFPKMPEIIVETIPKP